MTELIALVGIVATLFIGTVSPGPSFVMVARMAISSSRAHALKAAFGMGVGGVVFATAALFGLQAILLAVPGLYVGLKVLGGLYLCYLGYQIFRSAKEPLVVPRTNGERARRSSESFWLGLLTQLSNPKTAVVYASVFAAFSPKSFTWAFAAALVVLVFCIEAGWYSLVALLLSSGRPQHAYLSYKVWIDRTAGAIMFGLGIKLVTEAAKH
ncbi:MAG: threonine transporter [Bryobacterales bacterium]|nr:threonine transporter [Bryobacterales bacterium]